MILNNGRFKKGYKNENKGKTNEEIYGEERAEEIRIKSSVSHKGHTPWNKELTKEDPRVKRNIENSLKTKKENPNIMKVAGQKTAQKLKGRKNPEQSIRIKLNPPLRNLQSVIKRRNTIFKKYGRTNTGGMTGKNHSEEFKEKQRKKQLERIKQSGGVKIGRYEKPILDLIEPSIGFPIIRQYEVCGFIVDGYCLERNILFEIDEKYHKNQIEKDKIRENIIKKELNCSIIRIPLWNKN